MVSNALPSFDTLLGSCAFSTLSPSSGPSALSHPPQLLLWFLPFFSVTTPCEMTVIACLRDYSRLLAGLSPPACHHIQPPCTFTTDAFSLEPCRNSPGPPRSRLAFDLNHLQPTSLDQLCPSVLWPLPHKQAVSSATEASPSHHHPGPGLRQIAI